MSKMTAKQKTIIALCTVLGVVAIVVSTVFATVAYLTSSAAVSNVFTIGKVGITMTESKVNPDGTLYDDGQTQVDTNTYHLVPGTTYHKDPHINVAPLSEASYLFVLVRNDLADVADPTAPSIADQLATNGWAKYTKAATGWVYIYVGAGNVPAGDADRTNTPAYTYTGAAETVTEGTYYLFHNFTIANVDQASLDKYGAAKITLTAVAIQQKGFNTLADAWQAVIDTYPYIHTGSN